MALVSPDDTVRELFARYRRGGLDAALALLDDDVVLLLLALDCERVLRGIEDLRGMLAELRQAGVELDASLDALERRGDAVVASCTVSRQRPDGLEESQQHWVFHVVRGRLRRLSTYASRDEALSSLAALNALGPATSFDVDERRDGGPERIVRPTGEL